MTTTFSTPHTVGDLDRYLVDVSLCLSHRVSLLDPCYFSRILFDAFSDSSLIESEIPSIFSSLDFSLSDYTLVTEVLISAKLFTHLVSCFHYPDFLMQCYSVLLGIGISRSWDMSLLDYELRRNLNDLRLGFLS